MSGCYLNHGEPTQEEIDKWTKEAEIYSYHIYHPSEILFKPPQLPIPFWKSGEEVPLVHANITIDYSDSLQNTITLEGKFYLSIQTLRIYMPGLGRISYHDR